MENEFNVKLLDDNERNTQSWVMSDEIISEKSVAQLRKGFYDYLGISIYECPVFVFLVSKHNSTIGRISEKTSFVHPHYIELPINTFLVNSKFVDLLEGDNFFEQLSSLSPVLDEDMSEILKALFWELNNKKGLHCIATVLENNSNVP